MTAASSKVALQISRNLFQYFAADSEIVHPPVDANTHRGNIISVELGSFTPSAVSRTRTVELDEQHGVIIRRRDGSKRAYAFEEGLGAIFLGPTGHDTLELVVWGVDDGGLRQAARLLPMLTGVGQPEFIIVSRRCAWQGAGGVLAMGSFDNDWKPTEASFFS